MTIQLTRATVIAGSVQAAGTQHTLTAELEAHLIYQGIATRVGDAPDVSGPEPVYSNPAGTALVAGGGVLQIIDLCMMGLSTTKTAEQNSAVISAAMAIVEAAGGGRVTVSADGEYLYNPPLVAPDGLKLVGSPGAWLKQAAAQNKALIVSKAYTQTPATVTVSWSAGNNFSVAWEDHGLLAGEYFILQGAAEAAWWHVFRVDAVTDADNITSIAPFWPTAAPTGTITARRLTQDVEIDIGLDYNYAENPSAPSSPDRCAAVMAFMADSKGVFRVRDQYKYALMLAGNYNAEGRVKVINGNSDLVKVYGPARNVTAGAVGSSHDDGLSIQTKEPPVYIGQMPCMGNIDGVTIDNPSLVANGGIAGFAVYQDEEFTINDVKVVGGDIHSNATYGLAFRPGTGLVPPSRLLQKVHVKGTKLSAYTSGHSLHITSKARHMIFDNIKPTPGTNSKSPVYIDTSADIEVLEFRDLNLDLSPFPTTGTAYFFTVNGTLRKLRFRGCSIRGIAARTRLVSLGTNDVQMVEFIECDLEDLDQLIGLNASSSYTTEVVIRDCTLKTVHSGVNAKAPNSIVSLRDSRFYSMVNGVVRPEGAGVLCNVHESGCTFSSASPITCVSSGTAIPRSPTLPIDIGATGITKAAGAMAYHNGTTRGTIPQNSIVHCDGTNWYNAHNLAQTY